MLPLPQRPGYRGRRRWSRIERRISATTTGYGRLPGVVGSSRCLAASAYAAEPRRILSSTTSTRRPRSSPYLRACREHGVPWLRKPPSASCSASPVMWPRAPRTAPTFSTAPFTCTSTGTAGVIRAKRRTLAGAPLYEPVSGHRQVHLRRARQPTMVVLVAVTRTERSRRLRRQDRRHPRVCPVTRWLPQMRSADAVTTRPGGRLGVLVSSRCLAAAACAAEPRRILSSITSTRRRRSLASALACPKRGTP